MRFYVNEGGEKKKTSLTCQIVGGVCGRLLAKVIWDFRALFQCVYVSCNELALNATTNGNLSEPGGRYFM